MLCSTSSKAPSPCSRRCISRCRSDPAAVPQLEVGELPAPSPEGVLVANAVTRCQRPSKVCRAATAARRTGRVHTSCVFDATRNGGPSAVLTAWTCLLGGCDAGRKGWTADQLEAGAR
jgi:hypothetical protein